MCRLVDKKEEVRRVKKTGRNISVSSAQKGCVVFCVKGIWGEVSYPHLGGCQSSSPSLFSSCPAIVQAAWSSPSSAPQNKLAIQAPPFAVEGWGYCYLPEQGTAMAWTSASHSSAKARSHWPVACLRRASLEYEFVQVLSLWLYSHAEQNNLISQMVLAGTLLCIPSEPGAQNVIKSSLVVVFPCWVISCFFNYFSQIYMSPEVILCRGHTTKADIYSMGATIIHMQTGIPPWVNRYPRSAYPSYLYIVSVLSRASSVSVGGFPVLFLGKLQSYKNCQNICQRWYHHFLLQGWEGRERRSGFWSLRGRQETGLELSMWFVFQFTGLGFAVRTGLDQCETWLKQAHLSSTCLFSLEVADKNWSLADLILWLFQCGIEIWWIWMAYLKLLWIFKFMIKSGFLKVDFV